MRDRLDHPFRPPYELGAAAGWALAVMVLLWLAHASALPHLPFAIAAAAGFALAMMRLAAGIGLLARRARLAGVGMTRISLAELARKRAERPDAVWIGRGYDWTQRESQLAHLRLRSALQPARPATADELGQRWIHGLGADEIDLYVPRAHLAGHSLVIGTTGAGKTRLADLLVAQAILSDEAVIVFDPKGDPDLAAAMRCCCEAQGHPERFVYFHAGIPRSSVRIDPLRNYARPGDIAARIASLLPAEHGGEVFAGFAQMTLDAHAQALLFVDEPPSLVALARSVDDGGDALLLRCLARQLERRLPQCAERLAPYRRAVANGRESRTPVTDELLAHLRLYRDAAAQDPELAEPAIDALVARRDHDRTHAGKMLASLAPVLAALSGGELGRLLSPTHGDPDDPRAVIDFATIIEQRRVCYLGLDALSDPRLARHLGALLMADLVALAGARYNHGAVGIPIQLFVDEAAECCGSEPFLQLLNKGRGSGFAITLMTQTFADFAARLGSTDRARQVLANVNNLLALRLRDGQSQQYLAELLPTAVVRSVQHAHGAHAPGERPLFFSGSSAEVLDEQEVPALNPQIFGALPNLEYVGVVSAGRLIKGRFPIVSHGTALERR